MQYLKVLVILALLLPIISKAQSEKKKEITNNPNVIKSLGIRGSLDFYSTKFPGFQLVYQHSFSNHLITKKKKNGKARNFDRARLLEAQFGWNQYKMLSYNAAYLSANVIFRKTRMKGFFTEKVFGIGLQRNILYGSGYEVAENGDVTKTKNPGYLVILPQYTFSAGWDFRKLTNPIPFSALLNTGFYFQYPYNGNVLVREKLNIGIHYHFTVKSK